MNLEKDVGYHLDIKLPESATSLTHFEKDEKHEILEEVHPSLSKDFYTTLIKNEEDLSRKFHKVNDDIDLKDYSAKNVSISEESPFLKLVLPNNKTTVIKKSSYCLLLDEGNGKISTDRLKRFVSAKKKTTSSQQKSENKIK